MHFFALLFLISFVWFLFSPVAWLAVVSLLFLSLSVYFLFQYVKWNFDMEPKSKFWFWFKMKYLTNLSFIKGGLKDFKQYKILCIEPSF